LRGNASITLTPFPAHYRGRPYLDGLALFAYEGPRVIEGEWRSGRLALAPGGPGPSTLCSTLLLVVDGGLAPFDRPEAVQRLGAGIPRDDLVRRFVPGGQPALSLLPPAVSAN